MLSPFLIKFKFLIHFPNPNPGFFKGMGWEDKFDLTLHIFNFINFPDIIKSFYFKVFHTKPSSYQSYKSRKI